MFHVKRFFRRRPRPRILGETRPHYSRTSADHFARLGGAAKRAAWQNASEAIRREALDDLALLFMVSRLHANDSLLETIQHLCLTTDAYARGDATPEDFAHAEIEYYKACREALGIE